MKTALRGAFALLALIAGGADAQTALRGIYPASPVAGEPFAFTISGNTGSSPASVTGQSVVVNGTNITASITIHEAGFSVPGAWMASVAVPGLAAGTYHLVANVQNDNQATAIPVNGGDVVVAPNPGSSVPAYQSLSSNWFSQDESGWGANVIQGSSGQLFATWLTYTPTCSPSDALATQSVWFVMPTGMWIDPKTFRGLLYQTNGTPANVPWQAGQATALPAGILTMKFDSDSQMTFDAKTFSMCADTSKTKTVHKLQF